MCAINPTHKKRFIFDVYTSHSNMTEEDFIEMCLEHLTKAEVRLNSGTHWLRFHLKESEQKAD